MLESDATTPARREGQTGPEAQIRNTSPEAAIDINSIVGAYMSLASRENSGYQSVEKCCRS